MARFSYVEIEKNHTTENPSAELVEKRIRLLDDQDLSVASIYHEAWRLMIWGGNEGRVGVFYDKLNGSEAAILMDPDAPEDEEIVLSRQYIPETRPLNRTVSVDKAVEVALHFLKFGDFPEGLTWSKYPSSPPDWDPSKGIKAGGEEKHKQ